MKRWLRRLLKFTFGVALVIVGLLYLNLRPASIPEPNFIQPHDSTKSFQSIKLRLVTWNIWGLRFISPKRVERVVVIAKETAALNPDIVCFQEAFVSADREVLIEALRPLGLHHHQYFSCGLVGSGLLIVSRFPIHSTGFIRFKENGRPEALHHGDWWAGKGLSLCTVTLPDGTTLYVANTHFHARYSSLKYHPTQLSQAAQLVPWIRDIQSTHAPAIWLGDWNNTPNSDVLNPMLKAGGWKLLTTHKPRIDHIFASGANWHWQVLRQGSRNGKLADDPTVPWSDHAARWVEVELSR